MLQVALHANLQLYSKWNPVLEINRLVTSQEGGGARDGVGLTLRERELEGKYKRLQQSFPVLRITCVSILTELVFQGYPL